MSLKCSMCKKTYTRQKNLERHCQKIHTGETFECDTCSKIYSLRSELLRHIRLVHNTSLFECYHCTRKFKDKQSLTRHIGGVHKDQSLKTLKTSIKRFKCAICNEVFNSKICINGHYLVVHKIPLETEKLTLKSFEEFNAWKSNTQRQTITQFVKQYSFKTSAHDRHFFVCHRSSYNKADSRRKTDKRFPKRHGSKKLHTFCPAEMDVKINRVDGTCIIKYTSTHIGHTLNECEELRHINLTENERFHIAAQLKDCVSRNDLTQQELSPENTSSRMSVLRPNDITNVAASFLIDEHTFESDDAGVDIFVENNQESVLYYKNRSTVDSRFGVLKDDDFVLILMNKTQEEYLKRYGENVICFDRTDGTNRYHYLLHTLLVSDVDRVGYPAAFIITNRSDKTAIDVFLRCVKDRVGDIQTRVLMTDMQSTYYNSWISVMDTKPKFYLNCTWYVNEAWRRKYPRKSPLWPEVKRQLQSLRSELNPLVFEEKLANFLAIDDEKVKDFIDYFRDNYAQKPHLWAYFHRLHAGINVNMSLEAFHRELKYRVANGKHVNWLSHTLGSIKKYFDSREADVIKNICGMDTSKLAKLRRAHHDAVNFCKETNVDETLVVLDDRTFYVKSFSEKDVTYVVTKMDGAKECARYEDVACGFQCQLCEICFHEYECNCVENSIRSYMCEHIHVVGLYRQKHDETCVDISTVPSPVPMVIESESQIEEQYIDESNIVDVMVDDETCSYVDDEDFLQLKLEAHDELDRALEVARNHGNEFVRLVIKQYISQIAVAAKANADKKEEMRERTLSDDDDEEWIKYEEIEIDQTFD